jgi:hypothetical protein
MLTEGAAPFPYQLLYCFCYCAMLVIRDEQMRVFEAAARKRFEDRMMLRLALPDESEARDVVRLAVCKCLGYGIDVERDMEDFLVFMVEYSPDFEMQPEMAWARTILGRTDLPGTAKIRIIQKRLGNRSAASLPSRSHSA